MTTKRSFKWSYKAKGIKARLIIWGAGFGFLAVAAGIVIAIWSVIH